MQAEPHIRIPSFDDAATLGVLISSALARAPSAPIERDELGADLEQVGRDFVAASLFGNETLLLAMLGRHPAGTARLIPREFVRARHIATLQILVAPSLRGRGVGRRLRDAALAEAFDRRHYERVEMVVANHDTGLARLVSGRGWSLERIEQNGLYSEGALRDVAVWVADRGGVSVHARGAGEA